jgi:hypothetical protein
MSTAKHPFRVRKQSSSRALSETFVVVKLNGGRVSTWPHTTREAAQTEADDLNIGAMVKPQDEDPRPYDVRRAEAAAAYRAEVGR